MEDSFTPFLSFSVWASSHPIDCRYFYQNETSQILASELPVGSFRNLKAYLGTKVAKPSFIKEKVYGTQYFLLGSGLGGGEVFRVEHLLDSYCFKEYRRWASRDNDISAQYILSTILGQLHSKIKVVQGKALGDTSMLLPDIRGKDLLRVLSEKEVPEVAKKILIATWNELVMQVRREFKDVLKSPDFFEQDGILNLSGSIFFNGRIVNVWLKPDNVIIEASTGKMFIIDPY